jgi:hypothetical protein
LYWIPDQDNIAFAIDGLTVGCAVSVMPTTPDSSDNLSDLVGSLPWPVAPRRGVRDNCAIQAAARSTAGVMHRSPRPQGRSKALETPVPGVAILLDIGKNATVSAPAHNGIGALGQREPIKCQLPISMLLSIRASCHVLNSGRLLITIAEEIYSNIYSPFDS